MGDRASIRIIDVNSEAELHRVPPCADPRFDHRSCDYWEDDVRGSKSARASWWRRLPPASSARERPSLDPFAAPDPFGGSNPFAPAASSDQLVNPFTPGPGPAALDAFAPDDAGAQPNPFAPAPPSGAGPGPEAPRKVQLLARGQRAFGSYAKVLLLDDQPTGYVQFGPLSAYPRARRIRELYPALPSSPLPAVITCIATTASARRRGLARTLVQAVCEDLGARGFAAIETYPDVTLGPDEASAASPAFWEVCGFVSVVKDDRYPVMRLELA